MYCETAVLVGYGETHSPDFRKSGGGRGGGGRGGGGRSLPGRSGFHVETSRMRTGWGWRGRNIPYKGRAWPKAQGAEITARVRK